MCGMRSVLTKYISLLYQVQEFWGSGLVCNIFCNSINRISFICMNINIHTIISFKVLYESRLDSEYFCKSRNAKAILIRLQMSKGNFGGKGGWNILGMNIDLKQKKSK